MKAYYYDNSNLDQRAEHDSGVEVSETELKRLGVYYKYFKPDVNSEISKEVNELAKERDYKHRDELVVSKESFGDLYEEKIRNFFTEHLHEDEEIRYILDGAGYFDVRDNDDKWIRIRVERGDLLIVPAGIYHRFSTTKDNYIKAVRLFKDEPKWTPLNRPQDKNPFRIKYVAAIN